MQRNGTKPLSKIRARRESLGLTRQVVAVRAGIALGTLFLAESRNYYSPNTLAKLAPVLGVKPEHLA